MSGFYLISDEQVKNYLDIFAMIREVEHVYRLKSIGEAVLFPIVTHVWNVGTKDMDIKSGYIGGDVNVYGLKALTYIEENEVCNLPKLNGTMMLFNSDDGQLKGIIDSKSLTGFRTGAAGAVGIKYLARNDSKNLVLVGAGNQAFYNLAGAIAVAENLYKVMVYDPMSVQNAQNFVNVFKQRMKSEILKNNNTVESFKKYLEELILEPVENIEEAVKNADIIITATPSRNPLIKKEWVRKGTHINCIGADMEGKQELDEDIFATAKVFVDDMNQALSVGETETAVKKGVICANDICGEIGMLISGSVMGRICDEDITLFDTTGLALQDLMAADILIKQAEINNLPKYNL